MSTPKGWTLQECKDLCVFAGDMKLPSRIQEAMQMQVEADRRKRATILESEGLFPSPHSHICHILAYWPLTELSFDTACVGV